MDTKPILCINFDGVIHHYSDGWRDGSIYDNVVPGFFDWAVRARDRFQLVIYSLRTTRDMERWLDSQLFIWKNGLVKASLNVSDFMFVHEKPPAFLTIDHRAIQFRGDWSAWWLNPDVLLNFKPWTQGTQSCEADTMKQTITSAVHDVIIATTESIIEALRTMTAIDHIESLTGKEALEAAATSIDQALKSKLKAGELK